MQPSFAGLVIGINDSVPSAVFVLAVEATCEESTPKGRGCNPQPGAALAPSKPDLHSRAGRRAFFMCAERAGVGSDIVKKNRKEATLLPLPVMRIDYLEARGERGKDQCARWMRGQRDPGFSEVRVSCPGDGVQGRMCAVNLTGLSCSQVRLVRSRRSRNAAQVCVVLLVSRRLVQSVVVLQ